MRNKGSCKFDPYWKIERWNAKLMCWQVVQISYPTLESARLHVEVGHGKYRITECTENGFTILP